VTTSDAAIDENLTLWVSGLAAGISEDEVRGSFACHGDVVNVTVTSDESGNGSYAFITFSCQEDIAKVLQSPLMINDKPVSVGRLSGNLSPSYSHFFYPDYSPYPSAPLYTAHNQAPIYYPPYPHFSQPAPYQTFGLPSQDVELRMAGIATHESPLSPPYFEQGPDASGSARSSQISSESHSDSFCHVCSKRPPSNKNAPVLGNMAASSAVTSGQAVSTGYAAPAPMYYVPGGVNSQLQPLTPILTPAPSPPFVYSSSMPAFFPPTSYNMHTTPGGPGPIAYPSFSQPPPPYYPIYSPIPPQQQQQQVPLVTQEPKPQFSDPPPAGLGSSSSSSHKVKRLTSEAPSGLPDHECRAHGSNVSFFTSPYKRFSKYTGTPTRAKFPLQLHSTGSAAPQGGKKSARNDSVQTSLSSCSWYKEGVRWGHMDTPGQHNDPASSTVGESPRASEPDIVKDLENCRIEEVQ